MTSILHWVLHPNLTYILDRGQAPFLGTIAALLFAESGLLVGFFLPGDSLLFSAGLVAALAGTPTPLLLATTVFLAAAAGDQVGFLIGTRVGPALIARPDGRLFRTERLQRTQHFFERHGAKAVVLARFVPVIRTFTPVTAGIAGMRYSTFVKYNLLGAAMWAVLVAMLGYELGRRFPGLQHVVTPALLAIVLVSLVPMLFGLVRRPTASESVA